MNIKPTAIKQRQMGQNRFYESGQWFVLQGQEAFAIPLHSASPEVSKD